MKSASTGAVVQGINASLVLAAGGVNSLHDHIERLAGHQVNKTITLDANNATASENIFQITGGVQVFRLWAEIVDATTLANLTAASFDLYDSAAAVQITAPTGVLSGFGVGTILIKDALLAQPFDVADNANGIVLEAGVNRLFTGFAVVQKTGANTYIRFTYTTTDAPIDAAIKVYCEYRPLNGGTLVAV